MGPIHQSETFYTNILILKEILEIEILQNRQPSDLRYAHRRAILRKAREARLPRSIWNNRIEFQVIESCLRSKDFGNFLQFPSQWPRALSPSKFSRHA